MTPVEPPGFDAAIMTIRQYMESVHAWVHQRTWYLSGPMSGYPNYNFAMFIEVSSYLRNLNYRIVSPHECEPEPEGTPVNLVWERMMVKCFEAMKGCDGIILTRGWPESRGANLELQKAIEWGWPVMYYNEDIKYPMPMSRKIEVEHG